MARRISDYKKRDSDRSGFTELEKNLVSDDGSLVAPEEFDTPPPSKKSLGGEGDVSPGNTRSAYTDYSTPSENQIRTQYVTAGGGISYEQKTYKSGEAIGSGFFYVVGSNSAVTISANPQITSAGQGNKLTIECVGSSVTLQDGNGLSLRKIAVMNSGFILNLIYNATDGLWYETSRSHRTENLGEL